MMDNTEQIRELARRVISDMLYILRDGTDPTGLRHMRNAKYSWDELALLLEEQKETPSTT
jgi:hypothetical protein